MAQIENEDQGTEKEEIETEGEQQEPEAPTGESETDEDEEEVTVSIGDQKEESEDEDEEDDTVAPPWVKELRHKFKETTKKNYELKQKIQELESKTAEPKPQAAIDPGPIPTFEDCDYDSDLYQSKVKSWFETKAKANAAQARAKAEDEQAAKDFEQHVNRYETAKKKLKVKDYDMAELAVAEALTVQQRQILLEVADKPDLVVYALGKNPAALAELAKTKKAVLFSKAITKLEGQLKVGTKKKKLTPESKVRGSGSLSGVADGNLEKLRAEAERTGDYSKVHAYRREKRAKAG